MRTRAAIGRFWSDQQGSLTLEFMTWLTFLVIWMIFSVAIFLAWDSRNDAAKMSYTLTDLLSRQTEIDATLLRQTLALTDRLAPGRGGLNSMRVTSIRYDGKDGGGADQFSVLWSCGYRGHQPLDDTQVPRHLIPAMQPLDSILLTEFYTPFSPISSLVEIDNYEWANVAVIRPRLVREIGLAPGGCT